MNTMMRIHSDRKDVRNTSNINRRDKNDLFNAYVRAFTHSCYE